MHRLSSNVAQDEERLGVLAMQFRGTRRDDERRKLATEFADVVERLVNSGAWQEMPGPEDQLPDDWMPPAFFDYWSHRKTAP